jgi:hypothetical protein
MAEFSCFENYHIAVNRRLRTTTVRPTPDPDLLADINEARGNK